MALKMEDEGRDPLEKRAENLKELNTNKSKGKINRVEKSLREVEMVNKSTKNRSVVYRKFALLCIELKYLYVAVTRAKNRLIIFDEDNKTRTPIQRIWENLEAVDVLSK